MDKNLIIILDIGVNSNYFINHLEEEDLDGVFQCHETVLKKRFMKEYNKLKEHILPSNHSLNESDAPNGDVSRENSLSRLLGNFNFIII